MPKRQRRTHPSTSSGTWNRVIGKRTVIQIGTMKHDSPFVMPLPFHQAQEVLEAYGKLTPPSLIMVAAGDFIVGAGDFVEGLKKPPRP